MTMLPWLLLLAAPPQHDLPAMDHAGMNHPASRETTPDGGSAPPPVPADHAADALFDPVAMARARAALRREHGGMRYARYMLDRAEYRSIRGRDGYHWEGEGWSGGDLNRIAVKTEGEGRFGAPAERAEVQALYWRALDPWFNLEAGVRQDLQRGGRRHAVIGIDGLAPYWFEVGAQLFLSDRGHLALRVEGSYDQRITQRLILQPAVEINLAARDDADQRTDAGPSRAEAGIRLRYEITRRAAPYLGIHYERSVGRAGGDEAAAASVIAGMRLWF